MKKIIAILGLLLFSISAIAQSNFCRTYTPHATIHVSGGSFITYRNLSFNMDSVQADIRNSAHDIRFVHCKFTGAIHNMAIQVKFGCYNITVDSCDFSYDRNGFYAQNGLGGFVITNNQFLNMLGPYPLGHAIQLDNCNGAGSMIMYNNCQTNNGPGINPNPGTGDVINLFQSNGTSSSPILVEYNNVLGGGTATGSNGAAGIVAGDVGGSFQVVEYNTVVNGGAAGIIIQGGHDLIMEYNTVLEENTIPWGSGGIACFNVSAGTPSYNITVANNRINGYAGQYNRYRDTIYKLGTSPNTMPLPTGWSTNIIDRTLTRSILPATIYDICPPPVISYQSPLFYNVGQAVSFGPTSTGATVNSYTAASLPAGLSINTATGNVSGTPTIAKALTVYPIIAHGTNGNDTVKVSIQVSLNKPIVSYAANVYIYTYGSVISPLIPINTGGAIANYKISPSLPAGLVIDSLTGYISGSTRSVIAPISYTVVASNSSGSSNFVLNISINKKVLTLTTDSKNKYYKTVNPTLTATYAGFAFSDGTSSLISVPTISTTAATNSPIGVYPIIASGGSSNNYSFSYLNLGILTIKPLASNYGPIIKGKKSSLSLIMLISIEYINYY